MAFLIVVFVFLVVLRKVSHDMRKSSRLNQIMAVFLSILVRHERCTCEL